MNYKIERIGRSWVILVETLDGWAGFGKKFATYQQAKKWAEGMTQ